MNMSMILVFIFAKCLLYVTVSSKDRVKRQTRIVGGKEAIPHSHPYMASIQTRLFFWRDHLCGGSILNEYWVLTAAHCINDLILSWLPLDIIVGEHDLNNLSPAAQIIAVKERIAHPLHQEQVVNDIAVLRTESPFRFSKTVQPLYLPKKFDKNPKKLIAPGWGALKVVFIFPKMPGVLHELNVTYVPYKDCRLVVDNLLNSGLKKKSRIDNPLDEEKNICTGPLLKKKSMCVGDSGGPLVQYKSSRNYYRHDLRERSNRIYEVKKKSLVPVVIGIVSWTITPCGLMGSPTVFTRVAPYLDFINLHIND